jgi:hypothetical protein
MYLFERQLSASVVNGKSLILVNHRFFFLIQHSWISIKTWLKKWEWVLTIILSLSWIWRKEEYSTIVKLRWKYLEITNHISTKDELEIIQFFGNNVLNSESLWYKRHTVAFYVYDYRSKRLSSKYFYLTKFLDEHDKYMWLEFDLKKNDWWLRQMNTCMLKDR